ncbi:hypothetical protein, variant [Aphanomyces invadans]|uniref:Kinesin motor domain-containing protein n=1 Tax=Aphanomyces invadans TaxID=157072 RepID=A0A024TUM8_9STRA|nr:hypothetical protein, variant [Aphanomyces invadans]ETV97326.1 hypothetical protein, variant [Aphanomyces invadans]|eukprot:XP_008874034.1 hypothetical protein, variant [Aphanomyces invadans]
MSDVPLYVGRMGSYCCVCSDVATSPSSMALSTAATTTVAADPSTNRVNLVASSHDFDESLPTSFEFTSVLPSGFHPKDVFEQVSAPIEDVVREGFNTSMVCYGSSSLKRATTLGLSTASSSGSLLGQDPSNVSTTCLEDVLASFGQIGGILWRLFQHNHGLNIGLSCWVVLSNSVRDLLNPTTPPPLQDKDHPIQFKTIHVRSLTQALILLRQSLQFLDASAHVFVRVAVYAHETDQQLSLLHYVDLGRLSSEEETEFVGLFDALIADSASSSGKESQEISHDNSSDLQQPHSCTLSQFLAPLLAGNSKTFLLGFVDSHVAVSTLDLLWIMSGVRLISCACVKLTQIDPALLDFEPFECWASDKSTKPTAMDPASSSTLQTSTFAQKLFGGKSMRRRSSTPSTPSLDAVQPSALPVATFQVVPPQSPIHQTPPVVPLMKLPTQLGLPLNHTDSSPVAPPLPLASTPPVVTAPSMSLESTMTASATNNVAHDTASRAASSWTVLLEDAHLPAMAPPPPVVTGLDAASAATITATEAQLLRKHYDGLLKVLQDQHVHTMALQHQVDELQVAHQETEATYHVQLQDFKLANVDLRSKLRVLETQTGMQSVLDKYDVEIQTVTSQLEALRTQNLGLELKLAANATVDLRNRYRDIVKENVGLHEQVLALRKKERHFLSSKKVVEESAKKIDALSKLVTTKDDMLLEARLGEARLSAQVDHQQQKSLALQQQQAALTQEHEKAAEELVAVKMYLASIQTVNQRTFCPGASVVKIYCARRKNRVR